MDAYIAQLERMQAALEELRGEAALRQLCAIIELGKKHSDRDVVAEFAHHLVEVASAVGRLDYEMMGFGELRALYLSDERFADLRNTVLWYYKWLAERLPEYVEVPAEQVWGLLDQMEAFYRAEGVGLRPVHGLRCRAASLMGLKEEAAHHLELWESAERDDLADCPACETHLKVQILLDQSRLEDAIEAAEPVFSGEQSCEEVPAITFSRLLMPLLMEGKEELLGVCAISQRQVRVVPKLVGYLADHVMYLSLVGAADFARPRAYLMLARGQEITNDNDRFLISRAAWVHLAALRNAGIKEVRLPQRLGGSEHDDARRPGRGRWTSQTMPIEQAIAEYEHRTMELAAAFDRRNGTDRFTKRTEFAAHVASRTDWPHRRDET